MTAGNAMRLKWCQDAEAHLTDAQKAVWTAVHGMLPTGHPFVGTDYGLEVFLLSQIQMGASAAQLVRYIPKGRQGDRRQADRRMLAAGEPEAAWGEVLTR